jgi:16S rRNA processing protein RimM
MSTSATPENLLYIGTIVSVFGLRGQVKVRSATDHPDHLARNVKQVYLGPAHTPYQLTSVFEHKPGLLIMALRGVTNRDEAEDLRNTDVYIRQQDAAPLAEDEYFLHELDGLQVELTDGAVLGQVREVIQTGANEVLVVTRPGQADALIPLIRDVVEQLDIAGGRVVVRLIDGLLSE